MKKNSILYKLGYFYYLSRLFVLIFCLLLIINLINTDTNIPLYVFAGSILYNIPYMIIIHKWRETANIKLKWFCHDICHEHIYGITESVDFVIIDGRLYKYHKCLFCDDKDIIYGE